MDLQKIVAGIIMAIGVIISCGVGAICGALAGAILLPVKVFSMFSEDSTGEKSDKI